MTITPNHEIVIRVQGNDAVPPNPLPKMSVGETVRYSSPDGEVSVVFPDRSPFRPDNKTMTEVPGSVVLTLVSESGNGGQDSLRCRCFVTTSAGSKLGWQRDPSRSGGDHHVK